MSAESAFRVVIAVTESSPVHALWQAAMHRADHAQTDFLALFISDDRWHRAARLPFSCEISKIGGSVADFTPQRAEQVTRDAIDRAQRQLCKLAEDANIALVFEVLHTRNRETVNELLASRSSLLIAPSVITAEPIYAEFQKLNCEITLIDDSDERHEGD